MVSEKDEIFNNCIIVFVHSVSSTSLLFVGWGIILKTILTATHTPFGILLLETRILVSKSILIFEKQILVKIRTTSSSPIIPNNDPKLFHLRNTTNLYDLTIMQHKRSLTYAEHT